MDALRWPVVGPFLRWRHARTTMQLVLLAVALVVVVHGFIGPDFAPANLSTVATWVHYRGLIVISLLAAGNLFCFGCPFVRVRDWGRRLHAPTRKWPRWLRGKWAAVALFAAVLFSYELFDLWSLPRATALLVLGYFVAALGVDLIFRGASFCKHLCPIGQFNFIASTVSPFEVQIRRRETCQSCRTSDCISGRRLAPTGPVIQRGCELGLFLPSKVGNLDCTFCLDCVNACPHDNVAIALRTPALELAEPARRSGIGRIVTRPDLCALAVLFVFGAILNAFAMTAPVHHLEMALASALRTTSELVVLSVVFVVGLLILPMLLLTGAAWLSRASSGAVLPLGRIVMQYTYGLVPLGVGVWAAHYGFHFLTGVLTLVPVTQSAAIDLAGWAALGQPLWRWSGMPPGAVLPIQLGCTVLGAIGSFAVLNLIATRESPSNAGRALWPWALLVIVLGTAATWVLLQPMEMRGMGLGG